MSTTSPGAGGHQPGLTEDEQLLHKLGYAQELMRGWGGFSNFAISFTIISILAGCLTSYYLAIGWGGPVAATWGWLLVGGFCILVALAMGEIASTYPTAGGLYYWSSRLGGAGWGWFTGWFNLVGQVAVTAAIDFGAATFISSLMNLWFGYSLTKGHVFLTYTVIIALHGLINQFGSRLLAMINNISAWWHMGGVLVIVAVLLIVPDHHKSVGGTGRHAGIVCAEARKLAEVVAPEQSVELVSLPAAHHKVVVADALLATRDQFVPFGDQQLPVLMVEPCDACEGQFAALRRETFPEQRFPGLPFHRGSPFPDVQNQRAIGLERPGEGPEGRVSTGVVENVIEDATAQNRSVSRGRQVGDVTHVERDAPVDISARPHRNFDEIG